MIKGTIYTPHNHHCSPCNLTWHHDPRPLMPEGSETQEEFEKLDEAYSRAHHCPRCGKEQRWIDDYHDATLLHTGTGKATPIDSEPTYPEEEDRDNVFSILRRYL